MPSPTVESLHIYPIKSSAGISLSSAWVDDYGLSFDRRFVVADHQGQFITARTEPKLCLIQANLTATGLMLTAPGMTRLTILYQQLSANYQQVMVWQDDINAQSGHPHYDQWFSGYLDRPCQLLYFGEQSQRYVHNSTSQVAFADGYPLLLISQASLDDLNARIPNHQVSMAQFRPNIVVKDCEAFAEDNWQGVRIGEVEFELTKPCSRCIFTTVDPDNADKHPQQEPLTSLKTYRQVSDGDVMFGQNLVQLNQGQIKTGDKVTVLARQTPPVFVIPEQPSKQKPPRQKQRKKPAKKKLQIQFDSWQKNHQGNNRQSILEQGEDAGLILPYSCRGGMCGRCKIKLLSGEVEQITDEGLTEAEKTQGFVLACSAIPQSDLVVSKS